MKFFVLFLSFTALSVFARTSAREVFGNQSPEEASEALFHVNNVSKLGLGAQLVEKRKIEEYVGFVFNKRGDTKVPTYEEFKKDPKKYYDEDNKSFFKGLADKPSDSLHYCKKTPLKVVVCPEGSYTFTGSQTSIEESDASRNNVKEVQDKKSVIGEKPTASKQ